MFDGDEIVLPLKYEGVHVGDATVFPDGSISVDMHEANVYLLLASGAVLGVSISPILNPAVDGKLISRVENEKPITEFGGIQPRLRPYEKSLQNMRLSLKGNTNVQIGDGNTQSNQY